MKKKEKNWMNWNLTLILEEKENFDLLTLLSPPLKKWSRTQSKILSVYLWAGKEAT
jgi:hypothetical protein